MGNLVQELGSNYVSQYFQGAMMQSDGNLYRFVGMQGSTTAVVEEFLRDGNPRAGWREVIIPAEKLKGFASFSTPPLGYRNVMKGGVIQSVTHLTSSRSTRRGFRIDSLRSENLPVYAAMAQGLETENGWEYLDAWSRVRIVYSPEFFSLKSGLDMLQSGSTLGFAVNRDIAIAIDMDIAAKHPWTVYFKGMRVGGVEDNGTITIYNKIVNRQDVRSQLEIL